jgi:hypothetical protein
MPNSANIGVGHALHMLISHELCNSIADLNDQALLMLSPALESTFA